MPRILKRVAARKGEVKASDCWRTPPDCFAALQDEFLFGLDLAADAVNHLCPVWFGPGSPHPDALAADWWEDGFAAAETDAAFLNMPYSQVERWLAKVVASIAQCPACVIVVLCPYTPDSKWWRHTAHAVEIREIPHRVPYLKADGVKKTGAMFPSAILVFRPQPGIRHGTPRRAVWSWRPMEPAQ